MMYSNNILNFQESTTILMLVPKNLETIEGTLVYMIEFGLVL